MSIEYNNNVLSKQQWLEIERETKRAFASLPRRNLTQKQIISRLRAHYYLKLYGMHITDRCNPYWLGAALTSINAYFDRLEKKS